MILFGAIFSCIAVAQTEKQKRQRLVIVIDSILNSEVNNNKIPGAVIEIKKEDTVLYKHAYGYAERYGDNNVLLQRPEVMTTEHLFDIASLTKVIGTTTSVMLLADKGIIHIDDAVGKYIPAFNADDKKTITIRNLLTHTAGLDDWYPMYYRSNNRQQTYALIGALPLKYPVGAGRHYSDLGFTVLGEIIETVSHIRLDSFMYKNIFEPLGMQHTVYNPLQTGRFTKIAATSHGNPYEKRMLYDSSLGFYFKEIDPTSWKGWRTYTLRGEVNDGNAWYACNGISGAAGLFSTADDLQKLVDMLKAKGMVGTQQFISAHTVETFLTKDTFKNGLGWMMDPDNSFMKNAAAGSFGHTGFTGTSIAVVPQYGISVILLVNRQNMGLLPNGAYYDLATLRRQVFEAVMQYCK